LNRWIWRWRNVWIRCAGTADCPPGGGKTSDLAAQGAGAWPALAGRHAGQPARLPDGGRRLRRNQRRKQTSPGGTASGGGTKAVTGVENPPIARQTHERGPESECQAIFRNKTTRSHGEAELSGLRSPSRQSGGRPDPGNFLSRAS
jgi:hypothetical protein